MGDQFCQAFISHLNDEETVIEDVVKEYQRGGTRIIEEMEKTHQGDYQEFQIAIDGLKTELGKTYRGTIAEIERNARLARKNPVGKSEKEWRVERDNLMGSIDAAIMVCTK